MSRSRHARRRGIDATVWRAPIALALFSLLGLLSALIGDGAWDAVSWIGLGIPCLVCLWYAVPWRRDGPR